MTTSPSGLRILFATNWGFLPQLVGGLQWSLLDLCAALARAGAKPALLCRDLFRPDAFAMAAPPFPVFRDAQPAAALARVAADFRPDVCVVLAADATRTLVVAALAAGLPTALNVRTALLTDLDLPLRPGGILHFAASPFAARRLATAFGVRCHVLPPAVDRARFAPPPDAGPRDGLLFVNPSPLKGFETVRRIARARPRYRIVVAESWPMAGPWRTQLDAARRALPNLEFLAPQPDIRPLLARARALLMPTVIDEAWGRTATEAQLCGVPVIASTRGGLPHTVGRGGVCLDVDGPLGPWLAAVDRAMTDDRWHARLAAAARARAAAPELDLARVARRFLRLIEAHARRVRLVQLAGAA